VLCVAMRKRHHGILALAGIPNVSVLMKQWRMTSWRSQRKCLDRLMGPKCVLQEAVY
jgi:hypothetical protein